ncbi:glycosyltransferase family 1 protein [uncultured Chryseobacterium sp.]|uniref:glycosyltransferase family 4 protein n=1 Tax=uncultured Chryseobacterium sp. TaxID=259322 RepID=UPI0025E7C61A|nr:glycosyltransferase family 1 protein [uncultured Chryseobacterium sp.]
MRIGFDAFPMQVNPSGIGKYVLNLLDEIIKNIPEAEYYAYSNQEIELPETFKFKIFKREIVGKFNSRIPGKVWLKFFSYSYIKKDRLDFYISTTGFFPKLPKEVKKIVIVHDLNAKLVPETMGKLHYLTHCLFFGKDVESADFVICNSKGTAKRLLEFYGKDADEIINPPVSTMYYPRTHEEVLIMKRKYHISEDYILFVGNLEPRKNLIFVLKNFAELVKEKQITNTSLVIVGLKGWKNNGVQKLLEQYSNYVNVLGYVHENDLPGLYSGAKVFVYPSLYEGFGIPVREALLCGTPVITSDIPELREAGFIAANTEMVSYINPADENDFKKSILSSDKIKRVGSENPHIDMLKTISFLHK